MNTLVGKLVLLVLASALAQGSSSPQPSLYLDGPQAGMKSILAGGGMIADSMPGAAQSGTLPASSTDLFNLPGLPQVKYTYDAKYKDGEVIHFRFGGTNAIVIRPTGKVDSKHRWVWLTPMWLALSGEPMVGNVSQRYYVESILGAGFYVVGIDVGAACGSPANAELYERFYKEVVRKQYRLNPKARMLSTSHGGLIMYGWAFRYPKQVDRLVGLAPATDMRSWPGLEKVCGPKHITPDGLAYPLNLEQLKARLTEFNPIDNLQPLAKAHVKILHVHGDKDPLVPMGPNSEELMKRYRALGGEADLEVIKGLGHGGYALFNCQRVVQFLLQ